MPQFRMTDWSRSRAFYEKGMGFSFLWEQIFEPGFPVMSVSTRPLRPPTAGSGR